MRAGKPWNAPRPRDEPTIDTRVIWEQWAQTPTWGAELTPPPWEWINS